MRSAVEQVIASLDAGELRVAERRGVGEWTVNQWVKKAVLLSFRLTENRFMQAGELGFFDKVEPKFAGRQRSRVARQRCPRGAAGGGAARLRTWPRTSS